MDALRTYLARTSNPGIRCRARPGGRLASDSDVKRPLTRQRHTGTGLSDAKQVLDHPVRIIDELAVHISRDGIAVRERVAISTSITFEIRDSGVRRPTVSLDDQTPSGHDGVR